MDADQVWSLTQFYSVDFLQSRIGVKKCVFIKRTIQVSGVSATADSVQRLPHSVRPERASGIVEARQLKDDEPMFGFVSALMD